MNRKIAYVVFLSALLLSSEPSFSQTGEAPSSESLSSRISREISVQLSDKISGATIKLPSLDRLMSTSPLSDLVSVQEARLVEDKANGTAVVEIVGATEGGREIRQVIHTPYEAWVEVPVANKRIYPNTKLTTEDFKVQKVNVASGMAREYRGMMIDAGTALEKMESRQTILEGQFVTRTSVQRQPDLRKGEMIKLELISGELSLVTQAIVQEPAVIGERVRVLTLKTKKEIAGTVRGDRSVEVNL